MFWTDNEKNVGKFEEIFKNIKWRVFVKHEENVRKFSGTRLIIKEIWEKLGRNSKTF